MSNNCFPHIDKSLTGQRNFTGTLHTTPRTIYTTWSKSSFANSPVNPASKHSLLQSHMIRYVLTVLHLQQQNKALKASILILTCFCEFCFVRYSETLFFILLQNLAGQELCHADYCMKGMLIIQKCFSKTFEDF